MQVSVASLAEASIAPFSTQAVSVRIQGNAAALPVDRDLLFESRHSLEGISVFTHIVDCAMSDIMVRNDTNKTITIQRNGQLGSITEYDEYEQADRCTYVSPLSFS